MVHTDELTQKGNSAGGCDVVAGAQRAEERPWGGARESWSTEFGPDTAHHVPDCKVECRG